MVFSDYLRMVSLIVFGGKGLAKQDLGTVSQATGADLFFVRHDVPNSLLIPFAVIHLTLYHRLSR